MYEKKCLSPTCVPSCQFSSSEMFYASTSNYVNIFPPPHFSDINGNSHYASGF